MRPEDYIAQAAALQVAVTIKNDAGHLLCLELPAMDIQHFLSALTEETQDLSGISLSLVGYEFKGRKMSDDILRGLLKKSAPLVRHATTDIHETAKWRNKPDLHSRIITLVTGKHPFVSTLAHFPQRSARDLTARLLEWAQTSDADLAPVPVQRGLLTELTVELAGSSALGSRLSLSGVAAFLAAWKEWQAQGKNGAPRHALPQLGLLPDCDLFKHSDIGDRLRKNLHVIQSIIRMPGHKFDGLHRRIKRKNPTRLNVLERMEKLRLHGDVPSYQALDLNDVLSILNLKDEKDKPNEEPTDDLDPQNISRKAGELLIGGDREGLGRLSGEVSGAIERTIDGNGDDFPVNQEFLNCIRHFCSKQVWGGFFEIKTASLEVAVRDFSECECIVMQPLQATIDHVGERYDYRQAISLMEEELHKEGVSAKDFYALSLWDHIVEQRNIVLGKFNMLIHQPLLAMAADEDLRTAARELIENWESLYGQFADYYDKMHHIDPSHTRMLLEAIASLDILQIKTQVDDRRFSWKAILLPTHPLHLWRYERMAELSNGIEPELDELDSEAVLKQLQLPEHYLGVLYLTSFPKGKGGNQPLPVARDYHGLAVFENLKNAYNGSDGTEALEHCVSQFPQIYVNHTKPLRLALVNPPNAGEMLLTLLKNKRKRRGDQTTLLVDIYATEDHKARLLGTRLFSSKNRDEIEDHIASGRLKLRVHDDVISLTKLLDKFHKKPVHILAVFDEASTEMRRQPGGMNLLPMSPFAIRQRINFLGIRKKVELRPSMEGSVFRSFYDVLGKLDDCVAQTPQASADAGQMSELIVKVLTKPNQKGAIWFFFADRALPSLENSRVARILERRDGRRQSVCYDESYARLALPLRQPLDQFNLFLSDEQVEQLLEEGIALLGDRLIAMFQADGKIDSTRVLGFVGMLVAARDYRVRFPEALLVSVDTDLARLWLRVSNTGERCDLLALREENGVLLVEAIEVKTDGSKAGGVAQAEIQKASSQLASTLDAIQSGLQENEESTPLAAPRQEMLKEVFVSGCQSSIAAPDDRSRWCKWLKTLFRENERTSDPILRGTVYAVELRNNGPLEHKPLDEQTYEYDMHVRKIREERIQDLISPPQSKAVNLSAISEPSTKDDLSTDQPQSNDEPVAKKTVRTKPKRSTPTKPSPHRQSKADNESEEHGLRFPVGESLSASNAKVFHLHPSDTRLNQLNIGIVGDLGTGKTQLTQALIHQFSSSPEQNRGHTPKFLIFDYKHDYTKPEFVKSVKARVIKPPLPLNIFDLHATGDSITKARLGRVKFFSDALQKIYSGIGPRQRSLLKNAVMQSYENTPNNAPTLNDVLQQYKDAIGKHIDVPHNILSDLVDYEMFVSDADKAVPFDDFFTGVTVIDLASLGIGDREQNMLLVLLLNLYYEYMINLKKQPYIGSEPQLRFIDSMLLVDEADSIMKYNFDVLRQILLKGREFGVGVLLASQYLSHFRTKGTDYSEPLLTWFVHKVPNVTARELEAIGLNKVSADTVDQIKSLGVHECLYKTYSVPGRFIQSYPFHTIAGETNSLESE